MVEAIMEKLIAEYLEKEGKFIEGKNTYVDIYDYLYENYDENNQKHVEFHNNYVVEEDVEEMMADYLVHLHDGGERDYSLEEVIDEYLDFSYDKNNPNHDTYQILTA